MNVGGERVGNGLVASRVPRTSDTLNDDVEAWEKVVYPSPWPRGVSILLKKSSEIFPNTDL